MTKSIREVIHILSGNTANFTNREPANQLIADLSSKGHSGGFYTLRFPVDDVTSDGVLILDWQPAEWEYPAAADFTSEMLDMLTDAGEPDLDEPTKSARDTGYAYERLARAAKRFVEMYEAAKVA